MNYLTDNNAKNYLEKILAILDIEAQVHEEMQDESTMCYRIDCKATDAKVLIGRKGQTLEALQFLLRQMVKGARSEQGYFLIDVLNYRQRRREAIMDQAKEAAVAVLNGESEEYALSPMSAFERRIVHKYLQENFPELSSGSCGVGEDRHIVISYVGFAEAEPQDLVETEQVQAAQQEQQQTQEEQEKEEKDQPAEETVPEST